MDNYYTDKEIFDLLKAKERFVYADSNDKEVVIRYKDIPDYIVDYNNKFGQTDLEFYDCATADLNPLVTTFGSFLNKCQKGVREDIIGRLNYLQQGGEISNYKLINEEVLDILDEAIARIEALDKKKKI